MSFIFEQLITSKAKFNKKNLSKLTLEELKGLCLLMNTQISGIKEEIIKRLIKVYAVRLIVARFDDPDIFKDTYKKRVLVRLCAISKVWKGGNKYSCAVGLINWKNRSRLKAKNLIKNLKKERCGQPHQTAFKF